MPLHEYLCESCGRTFELIQSFSEARLTICDRCGGQLKRLISAPAVQFKGSGWYVSDYGKSGSSAGTKRSEGGESGAAPAQPAPSAPDTTKKPGGDTKP